MRTIYYLLTIVVLLASASKANGQYTEVEGGTSTSSFVEEPAVVWLPMVINEVMEPAIWLPFVINYVAPTVDPPNWSGVDGSIVCLAGDPANDKIIYAGTWGGGVFRSDDQGTTWVWASSGMTNFLIDSLVVDPTDSQILYAGTHAGGLFKTVDRGQHWFAAGAGIQEGAAIYTIAVNPGDNQVLYAGTRKTGYGLNTPYYGVLYKSTSGGAEWYPVLTDVGGPDVKDWVYSVAIKTGPNLILAAAHENGPYRSTTGEAGDWQRAQVSSGIGSYTKGRAVAFDPRPGALAAFYATWHGGLYLSSNNGSSLWLEKDPLDRLKVYPNGIVFARNAPNTMFLATMDTNDGVFKSTNAGRTWATSGLNNEQIYTVLAPSAGDIVFAGTAGNGLYKSTTGGRTWFRSMKGMEIHSSANVTMAAVTPLPPEPMEELLAAP